MSLVTFRSTSTGRLAVPDHQPALRARSDGDHHQPRLQTLVADLQQRQHLDLRHPRPRPAPRRHRHHRRQELPHEGRDRRIVRATTMTRSRKAKSSEYAVSDEATAYIADAL